MTLQVKTAAGERSAKAESVLTGDTMAAPPMLTKTITVFVDHSSEWNTTGTVTPPYKCTETATLLIFHSMSKILDEKMAVRVTNTTELPYLIKRNKQISEFFLVIPERFKFIKPVASATLSMIAEGDTDLITYLNKNHRTNEPEQEINTFWFPTTEFRDTSDTSIQTRILKE